MSIYKSGSFVADDWLTVDAGQAAPASGHVIFTLDWWRAERQAFEGSNVAIGLRIEPGTKLDDIADDIGRFALIAVDFPKFQDGRGFSQALLLRDRYKFRGELRAVGEILLDQIQPLIRCGFTSFEIKDDVTESALREGRIPAVHYYYQPGHGPEAIAGSRPWTRRPTS